MRGGRGLGPGAERVPPPRPVPRGSRGYGEGSQVSMETGGSEGSAFGQEHKGDRGRAGGGETTGNAPGLQMASGCWAPRCLPLGWICHQPRAPSTVPGSLLPAPCPHHQPHIPITTPNPCPPGEHLVRDRTGAQSSHPLRDFPSCPPRAVSPPVPSPRYLGAPEPAGTVSPSLPASRPGRPAAPGAGRPDPCRPPCPAAAFTEGKIWEGREDLGRDEPVLRACVSASKI